MNPKDKLARENYYGKQVLVDSLLLEQNLTAAAFQMKLQAFKAEQILEVFLRAEMGEWKLVRSYPFCHFSGGLGPKLKEGDRQIPEGIYKVAVFNPKSKFYLSLGLDYPNARDMEIADADQPGSDIYIHGGCATVGCIPITDEKMAELYLLAKMAAPDIDVLILPFRSTNENRKMYMEQYPQWESFWTDLFEDADLSS